MFSYSKFKKVSRLNKFILRQFSNLVFKKYYTVSSKRPLLILFESVEYGFQVKHEAYLSTIFIVICSCIIMYYIVYP